MLSKYIMLNSNQEPELVFTDGDMSPPPFTEPYKNFDDFFKITKKKRQYLNEKGIMTFPFDFGYKLANTPTRYGKIIKPWGAWKNADKSILPNLDRPHNFGVMTGRRNNLMVIDYDLPNLDKEELDGLEFLKSVIPDEHPFWKTYQVKSASGGLHIYCKYHKKIPQGTRSIIKNGIRQKYSVDIRNDGGCVIGEGSITEKGEYKSIIGNIDNLQPLPEELLHFLIPPETPTNAITASYNNNRNTSSNNNDPDNKDVDQDKLRYINFFNTQKRIDIFGEYDNWWMLARVCANHFNFNIFYTISCKAPTKSGKKHDINACRDIFNLGKNQTAYWGAFINFIKNNFPQDYNFEFGFINKYAFVGDEESFNQLLYNYYKDRFKYDPENEIWYECCDGLWKKRDKKNLILRRLIAEEFIKIFRKKDYGLSKQLAEIPEKSSKEDEIERLTRLRAQIHKQIEWCRSNNKRASFVNSNCDMFCDYDFLKKLDANEISGHLFSFNNGYIDLNEYAETKNVIFHNHKPDNYISITCGYSYSPKSEIDNSIYNECSDLVKSILPDAEDSRYILQAFASCLTATNNFEHCYCLYGRTGGNGKGLLCTILMKEVFGEYSGTYKTENICGKKSIDPENASSGLASIMKCRYVYMAEPDKNEEVNNEALKLLTGGDEIQYRKLHQNMLRAVPSFTLFLQTNNILNTDAFDEAVWRRLKYIYFNQTFRVDPSEKELAMGWKKADTTLKKKFTTNEKYKQAFIHLLLENYVTEIKDTENIKKYTALSRNENDTIKTFIDEMIEPAAENEKFGQEKLDAYNAEKFITLKELKTAYHIFHQMNYDEACPYKLKDLKTAFLNKIGDRYKARFSTQIYNFHFGEIIPVKTNTNRIKKKNWSDCFIGYKLIEQEYEEDNDNDEIEYAD